MPMYRYKDIEARFCTEDNIDDISSWADTEARLGCYYTEDGFEYEEDDFLDMYEEAE